MISYWKKGIGFEKQQLSQALYFYFHIQSLIKNYRLSILWRQTNSLCLWMSVNEWIDQESLSIQTEEFKCSTVWRLLGSRYVGTKLYYVKVGIRKKKNNQMGIKWRPVRYVIWCRRAGMKGRSRKEAVSGEIMKARYRENAKMSTQHTH